MYPTSKEENEKELDIIEHNITTNIQGAASSLPFSYGNCHSELAAPCSMNNIVEQPAPSKNKNRSLTVSHNTKKQNGSLSHTSGKT
jgi:hypothetical protein